MNVNEVIANRALQILGRAPGDYETISPIGDVNLHQSTNDTFPTALRLAAIRRLHELERAVVALQEACQRKEKEFAGIVKIGRTELQDAVLFTLGREIGAWAEAFGRDRWRIYKCEERLRVIDLGGTAIGTGLGAPREFIFRATDELRNLSGIGFARAENLIDRTQNADVFVEVSGILKASRRVALQNFKRYPAAFQRPRLRLSANLSLNRCRPDRRSCPARSTRSFPRLPPRPRSWFSATTPRLPWLRHRETWSSTTSFRSSHTACLESIDVLAAGCEHLSMRCIDRMKADEKRCSLGVQNATASATALIPLIGYEKALSLMTQARPTGHHGSGRWRLRPGTFRRAIRCCDRGGGGLQARIAGTNHRVKIGECKNLHPIPFRK